MSLQFSDTTNFFGLIQQIERALAFNDGDISGNTTRLAQFTADINLAIDDVYRIIFNASSHWQFDDSNHTGYPILTANIVSGQSDYTFTTDGDGNLIVDIFKVRAASDSGDFKTLKHVDKQSDAEDGFGTTSGTPTKYDLTANGIFLDPVPDYNETGGLQMFVNREASYFTTSDTTKKAGFNGLLHEYLVLKPAYKYARAHGLPNGGALKVDLFELQAQIEDHYGRRGRDIERKLTPAPQDNR